ncbi:flavin-containing monooxygenase [Novosphingobium taihuense]|uniref:Cation diffusion facilitator CzcD-associated flavoprotein CzcO n=1 Tax=Novosphingobium taihuense TaxID=260085 RepID=A0A7W7ETP3_9SPHN|nr:NAD(P)/FAD-dependent oxidoreductase [Novosphingobium taihuense]MBB4613096.1 cation diffusion facilitator CzcD-associated flavoprotein CzcO [Novosphingobium taihuense]TWH85239.1 cation diffusion facilitator CzcD-associated flavoprotein CzcO [Novosphingobium taihuense]
MGAEQSTFAAGKPDVDVLIVGAGISGIGMAAHMKMLCPDRSFAIIERRAQVGGTWDLFRYPGVRSDSDMHTLGFIFEPWKHEKSIADGPAILDYLNRIVDERDIRRHIRFDSKVVSADFDSETAHWVITLEGSDGQRSRVTAGWIYLGSGYYDYDKPYEAQLEGREDFKGEIIHPQFWPENLDYTGKRVVVIGSGATAVTIVPSMAAKAAHVTMLQRTPTWYGIRPARDALANFLRKILPEELAYRITRWKNVRLQNLVFKRARTKPEQVKQFLTKRIKAALGDKYDEKAFTPPYDPWDQRLCLVPDADLFEAIKVGKASVVTDHIDRFDATGIKLKSGKHLDADVIVTATGLKMVMAGKIAISVDGVPVDFADRYYYKGVMFSNVPNLAAVFGYLNASWTLRADINARYICDVLNAMKARGVEVAVPSLAPNHHLDEDNIYDFSSGYIERARHLLPKSASDMRWRLNQDYVRDVAWMRQDPIEDGVLQFGHPRPTTIHKEQMEVAE